MPTDDLAARKARATRLRQQIGELVSSGEEKKPARGPESPREFIHRKMKEFQAPSLKSRKDR